MSLPLTGLAPVTVGVDVLPEGEEDPGVGEPWAHTTVLHNMYLSLCTSDSEHFIGLQVTAAKIRANVSVSEQLSKEQS